MFSTPKGMKGPVLLGLAQSGTLDKVLGAGSERTSKAFEGSPLMDPVFTYEGSLLRMPTLVEAQMRGRSCEELSLKRVVVWALSKRASLDSI